MTNFHFYNPVKIEFGPGCLQKAGMMVGGRKAVLITTAGMEKRGGVSEIRAHGVALSGVLSGIAPTPDFAGLAGPYAEMQKMGAEVILAMGGGSVIDTAKILSVRTASRSFDAIKKMIQQAAEPLEATIPVIAIPTTSGTGSEVTPWATVWDSQGKNKYSLQSRRLFPESCLCDPQLTLSLPEDMTIWTGLDALSHSFEAIWNKNANPVSTVFARKAAGIILKTLPLLKNCLEDLALREAMMLASLYAGLASSNTETAIAHAISYYLTLHYGVHHGLACGFSLPAILEAAAGRDPGLDTDLSGILEAIAGKNLRDWFREIGIETKAEHYHLSRGDLSGLADFLSATPRAGNFLFPEQLGTILGKL